MISSVHVPSFQATIYKCIEEGGLTPMQAYADADVRKLSV